MQRDQVVLLLAEPRAHGAVRELLLPRARVVHVGHLVCFDHLVDQWLGWLCDQSEEEDTC